MALTMARPWKHPNTGVYWLRKRIPDDLRALVGKREEKRSLRTKDPAEAKTRHAEALLEIERRWASVRARGGTAPPAPSSEPGRLTEAHADELTRPVYDSLVDGYWHRPSSYTFWPRDLGDELLGAAENRTSWDLKVQCRIGWSGLCTSRTSARAERTQSPLARVLNWTGRIESC
jgi:hypothetical protein